MTSLVLDASAIIAVQNSELPADLVLGSMAHGFISAVNYSEVVKKAGERLQESTSIPAAAVQLFHIHRYGDYRRRALQPNQALWPFLCGLPCAWPATHMQGTDVRTPHGRRIFCTAYQGEALWKSYIAHAENLKRGCQPADA